MGRIPIQASSATTVTIDGREVLSFGGNNYAALAHHQEVVRALCDAAGTLGLTTTASRETTGNTTTHEALEEELAEFLGTEAAILTTEGYTANIALAQSLVRDFKVALIDEVSHRSIVHAVSAAGFEVHRYKHLSMTDAARLASEHADRGVTIWTDTVFAADGAIARLPGLLEALPQGGGALIADDCHGFCALGPQGRGAAAYFGLRDPRLMITTTLAKGLGCYGGCIAATGERIASVREHSGIYRGTTPVPPPYAHAARAAIRVMLREDGPAERLADNARLARSGLQGLGISVHSDPVPIMTFTLEPREFQERAHEALLRDGILAPLIEYPGGPAERYFRVTVNAAHTPEMIQRMVAAFAGQIRGWHAQHGRAPTGRAGRSRAAVRAG